MLCTAWYDARNTITSSAYSEITSNSLAKTKGFKTLISLSSAKTVYSVFWHNSFSFCKSYLLCKVVIQFSNDATRQYLLVWVTSTTCSILVAFICSCEFENPTLLNSFQVRAKNHWSTLQVSNRWWMLVNVFASATQFGVPITIILRSFMFFACIKSLFNPQRDSNETGPLLWKGLEVMLTDKLMTINSVCTWSF